LLIWDELSTGETGEDAPVSFTRANLICRTAVYVIRMCGGVGRCAVEKRNERMSYRGSALERGAVKHPPYPDLETGWGV